MESALLDGWSYSEKWKKNGKYQDLRVRVIECRILKFKFGQWLSALLDYNEKLGLTFSKALLKKTSLLEKKDITEIAWKLKKKDSKNLCMMMFEHLP